MEKKTTVFYVDDNPKSRRLLTSLLESRGFTVITEEDPLKAVVLAGSVVFDVALLDYQMPRMTGTELAAELRRGRADLPVVVISHLEALPSEELACVDVHLGCGTRVDHLLETIEMLAYSRPEETTPYTRWYDST